MKGPTHERDVMRKLDEFDPTHVGFSRIVHLSAFFVHEGPTGQHVCLVYNAMGESLSRFQAKLPEQKLGLPITKRVARQILEGLDYIHTCGVVHTGKAAILDHWVVAWSFVLTFFQISITRTYYASWMTELLKSI